MERLNSGTSLGPVPAAICTSPIASKWNRPDVYEAVPLFNPRTDRWDDHFCWDGYYITGLTPIGRATIDALVLNHERRIKIRQAEALFDLFPPGSVVP